MGSLGFVRSCKHVNDTKTISFVYIKSQRLIIILICYLNINFNVYSKKIVKLKDMLLWLDYAKSF